MARREVDRRHRGQHSTHSDVIEDPSESSGYSTRLGGTLLPRRSTARGSPYLLEYNEGIMGGPEMQSSSSDPTYTSEYYSGERPMCWCCYGYVKWLMLVVIVLIIIVIAVVSSSSTKQKKPEPKKPGSSHIVSCPHALRTMDSTSAEIFGDLSKLDPEGKYDQRLRMNITVGISLLSLNHKNFQGGVVAIVFTATKKKLALVYSTMGLTETQDIFFIREMNGTKQNYRESIRSNYKSSPSVGHFKFDRGQHTDGTGAPSIEVATFRVEVNFDLIEKKLLVRTCDLTSCVGTLNEKVTLEHRPERMKEVAMLVTQSHQTQPVLVNEPCNFKVFSAWQTWCEQKPKGTKKPK